MLLTKTKLLGYVDPTNFNLDACNKGEAFVGNFLVGDEQFLLVDP